MDPSLSYSEAARLRRSDADAADERSRADLPDAAGPPTLLVRTFTETTYPTVAAKFYACHPVLALGTESEGSSGSLTVDTGATVYVFNLGSAIPASGTDLLATFVEHRWVVRYDG